MIVVAAPRFEPIQSRPILRISESQALRASLHRPELGAIPSDLKVEMVLSRRGQVERVTGASGRVARRLKKWRFFPITARGEARRAVVTMTLTPEQRPRP